MLVLFIPLVRIVVASLLLLFASACGRESSRSVPDASAPLPSASASSSASVSRVEVLDAGKEPRSLPGPFAFVKDSKEHARLVIDSRLERQSVLVNEEHLELKLSLSYTSSDTVELAVERATTTAPDIYHVETTVGTRFKQKVYPSGELDPPEDPVYPQRVDPVAGDYVRGAVVQAASNFLPVMPKEAVGVGARWALRNLRFSLVEQSENRKVIERRSEYEEMRPTPTGTALAREAQLYRIESVPDGLARRVEAELVSEHPPGSKRTTRLLFEVLKEH